VQLPQGQLVPRAMLGTLGFLVAVGLSSGQEHEGLDWLIESVPGVPGEDYPIYAEVPDTGFTCDGQVEGGKYADPAAECQAFHVCALGDMDGGLLTYSFLCPNGTIFNQEYFICDWWFNVDCSQAEGLYSLNDEIAAEAPQAAQGGSGGGPPPGGFGGGGGGGGGRPQQGYGAPGR